jgi:hypothetical protein
MAIPVHGDAVAPEGVPAELHHIKVAIESSRSILSLHLQPDWDDEEGEPYSETVWKRATEFVMRHALWLWKYHCIVIEAPAIEPGPHGSIDIHWTSPSHELLLNIPKDPAAPASFYGDDRSHMVVKGTLDPATYNRGCSFG